jgi:acyl-CoA thioesterase FadM
MESPHGRTVRAYFCCFGCGSQRTLVTAAIVGSMSIVIRLPSPTLPNIDSSARGRPSGEMRYDDVAQDGRFGVLATTPTVGWLWRDLITHLPGAREMQGKGTIPVLTRLIVNTSESPARVDQPLVADGGFYIARNSAGSHLYLNIAATLLARGGRLLPLSGPDPEFPVANIFAEHTFTNIFGAPGQRSVTRLHAPGFPEVPEQVYDASAPALVAAVPIGATLLADLQADSAQLVAGFDHTDSNQHVNSLVYVRWFIEAALRRVESIGKSSPRRLTRSLEIAYRKPCFAGDRIGARLALYQPDDDPSSIGAAGSLHRGDDDKPCAFVKILLA